MSEEPDVDEMVEDSETLVKEFDDDYGKEDDILEEDGDIPVETE